MIGDRQRFRHFDIGIVGTFELPSAPFARDKREPLGEQRLPDLANDGSWRHVFLDDDSLLSGEVNRQPFHLWILAMAMEPENPPRCLRAGYVPSVLVSSDLVGRRTDCIDGVSHLSPVVSFVYVLEHILD